MNDINIFRLTAAIADPVRLSVMMYLIRGQASYQEIQQHLNIAQSNLSNHLKVLVGANLIHKISQGRSNNYEIAGSDIAQLIELLLNLQKTPETPYSRVKNIGLARTCYDHVAGKLGVAIFQALIDRGAIGLIGSEVSALNAPIQLSNNADVVFTTLGVNLSGIKAVNRKFAYACLDWTEKKPHLAGALGAALCQAMMQQKWVIRNEEKRVLRITDTGKNALKEFISLDFYNKTSING